jgi:hypothetical protein
MNFNGPSWLLFLIGLLVVLAIIALVAYLFDFSADMIVVP